MIGIITLIDWSQSRINAILQLTTVEDCGVPLSRIKDDKLRYRSDLNVIWNRNQLAETKNLHDINRSFNPSLGLPGIITRNHVILYRPTTTA